MTSPVMSPNQKPSRSIFVRYFFLILTLVFVLLALFSLYIFHMSSRNYQDQQILSQQGILKQATERVDNTLYLVSRLAAGTSQNPDIVTSAIVPSLDNPQKGFAIVSALGSLVKENIFIEKAYLYEHTKGYVFSSDSLISTLSGMADSAIISNCLYSPSHIVLQEEKNRSLARLLQDGQILYFIYDFIYTNDGPLSTLILEINKEELFASFLGTPSLDQFDVSVFGNRITPVYLTPSTDQEALADSVPSMSYSSGYSGWVYKLYPKTKNGLSRLMNLRQLFPFLSVLILVSLILSYFITRQAYSPIQQLTNLVGGQTGTAGKKNPVGREFVFLEGAYQKLMLDNETASSLIQTARPVLEGNLFSDLLSGKEIPEAELATQLSRLESSFHINDKYQVLLFELKDASSMDPLSVRLCMLHLQQTIGQLFDASWGCYHLINETDDRFRMILCYPGSSSMAQVKRSLRSFTIALNQALKQSSIPWLYECGTVSNTLSDLRGSSEKAAEKLRQAVYYSDAPEALRDGALPKTISGEYFSSLLAQIGDNLKTNDLPLAQTCITRLLDELFAEHRKLPLQRSVCEKLMDVLIEKLLPYQMEESAKGTPAYAGIYEKMRTAQDAQELRQITETETASLLEMLRTESKKSQKRIIAHAKDYIASNYSNANLSINEIAQYAGCSASYLSAIFSEYAGENLVTCLNNYRISMACDLLANSQILIRDVGLKVGFNTIQNFNRVFKKQTGMTPNEYRKSHSV